MKAPVGIKRAHLPYFAITSKDTNPKHRSKIQTPQGPNLKITELGRQYGLYISGIRSGDLWYPKDALYECICSLFPEDFLNLVGNLAPPIGLDQPHHIINAQRKLVPSGVWRLAAQSLGAFRM